MMSTAEQEELLSLAWALWDQTISAEHRDRLQTLLRSSAEARRLYLLYMNMVQELVSGETPGLKPVVPSDNPADWDEPDLPRPPAEDAAGSTIAPGASRLGTHRIASRLWGWGLVGIAASILIVLIVNRVGRRTEPSPNTDVSPSALDREEVAVLTRVVQPEWDAAEPPAVGSGLRTGRLRLKRGLAQLEFYSGATVVLEGPADFELLAVDRGFCHQGRLRARLSPRSRGFTIGTAAGDLVDLGTEFGMHIDPNGRSEFQVFDGKVELYRKAAGRTKTRQEMVAGQGVEISAAGTLRPTAAQPDAFVSVGELERRSLTELAGRYRAWEEASRQLQSDPRVVLYYNFEDQPRSDRTVHHRGPGERGSLDGAIVGCQWIQGRWPDKGALDFKRPSDRVRIHVPGNFASLTFLAWVRVDAIENRLNSLLLTDGFDEGEPHWQLTDRGELRLGVRWPSAAGRGYVWHDYDAPVVLRPERLGQWLQLATVYDRGAGTVSHYVDGRPVSREPIGTHITLRIGEAQIGNWGDAFGFPNHLIRNLNGRIDELVVFGDALAPGEILHWYECGKPGS